MEPCVVCDRARAGDFIAENSLAAALLDACPVSPGHSLVIPRRHEGSCLALPADDQRAICTASGASET